jgi:hypothetical protein
VNNTLLVAQLLWITLIHCLMQMTIYAVVARSYCELATVKTWCINTFLPYAKVLWAAPFNMRIQALTRLIGSGVRSQLTGFWSHAYASLAYWNKVWIAGCVTWVECSEKHPLTITPPTTWGIASPCKACEATGGTIWCNPSYTKEMNKIINAQPN